MSSWRIVYLHFHNALVFSLSYFKQVCSGKLAHLFRAIAKLKKKNSADSILEILHNKILKRKKTSDLIQNGIIYDQAERKMQMGLKHAKIYLNSLKIK